MIYLKNATYIDWKTLEFKSVNIKVEEGIDGKFELINVLPDNIDLQDNLIIDCKNKFVTKSFANGHHHVYSALARGMKAPKKIPRNFYEILKYIWWTLDKSLDMDMIETSALITAIACAKNGVTFVIDHHSSPFAIKGSLETISKAFDRVGVSHLLCYEISDRDGLFITEKALRETEDYLRQKQGLVGLHASFTVGDNTLKKAVDMAEKYNSGIHVHTAEDHYDQKYTFETYNKNVIERFNEYGVLNFNKTILVHCLHLSKKEKEIISKSKSWVVQNTESNLNNNVGYFNSQGLGNNIMLGTDGMHSDMLRSAKASFLVGQGYDTINLEDTYKRFRKVHKYIDINNFKGDKGNNLVVLDYDTPTELNNSNFLSHFIYGIESKHVLHVISNGKLIVKDKQIQTVNEHEILETSKEMGKKLWNKMKKFSL
ncbi:MAG: amidohydrolase family protein [Bacteroidales bacterium]|nr:amidohydrolase family protein [Bacteroidales bacterium]